MLEVKNISAATENIRWLHLSLVVSVLHSEPYVVVHKLAKVLDRPHQKFYTYKCLI